MNPSSKKLLEANLTANDKESWEMVIDYLRREIKVKELLVLFWKAQNTNGAGSSAQVHHSHGNDGVKWCYAAKSTTSPPSCQTETKLYIIFRVTCLLACRRRKDLRCLEKASSVCNVYIRVESVTMPGNVWIILTVHMLVTKGSHEGFMF